MPTSSWFTTSPTATSSLFLGSATYFFRTGGAAFLCGVATRGGRREDNESLGARDHVDAFTVERGPTEE